MGVDRAASISAPAQQLARGGSCKVPVLSGGASAALNI
jgi:hypothetical protein